MRMPPPDPPPPERRFSTVVVELDEPPPPFGGNAYAACDRDIVYGQQLNSSAAASSRAAVTGSPAAASPRTSAFTEIRKVQASIPGATCREPCVAIASIAAKCAPATPFVFRAVICVAATTNASNSRISIGSRALTGANRATERVISARSAAELPGAARSVIASTVSTVEIEVFLDEDITDSDRTKPGGDKLDGSLVVPAERQGRVATDCQIAERPSGGTSGGGRREGYRRHGSRTVLVIGDNCILSIDVQRGGRIGSDQIQ